MLAVACGFDASALWTAEVAALLLNAVPPKLVSPLDPSDFRRSGRVEKYLHAHVRHSIRTDGLLRTRLVDRRMLPFHEILDL